MNYFVKETPAGKLLLTGDGTNVTGIYWDTFTRRPKIEPDWIENEDAFKEVVTQLDEYFRGERQTFSFPYAYKGTDFQKSVWQKLEELAYGKTSSYQAIAQAIGKPKAVRAVGTAVGSNPICIVVPCHRILRADGGLGGYAGGLPSKKILLGVEGIPHLA